MKLEDITVYNFKKCYNGDLSSINNDEDIWQKLHEEYEERTKSQGGNTILEIQKQIAIKENTVTILNTYLFVIQQAFKAYISSQDEYYINEIVDSSKAMKRFGIIFNTKNDIHKEFARCVKLVKNKANQIKPDIEMLKESTKGSMSFDKLVAIVGKFSGGGIIKQKEIYMDEFCEFYNLMTTK